jgi:hydroxyethylthiazole kinase-like uncharacterized protein yjeF
VPEIDAALLARRPLPDPSHDEGKHDRGTVLVVGATEETPGALVLAGLAALRVGAGRLQLAAPCAVAPTLAVHLPEAQVLGIEPDGSGTVTATERLVDAMARADVVVVGPGLGGDAAADALLDAALGAMATGDGRLVVDAGALAALGRDPEVLGAVADRTVATPNPDEAAALAGDEDVDADADDAVDRLVARLGCAVALRGAQTWIASPSERRVVERGGPVALATSGSGDVLAGMVAGHLARGASPFDAAVWAVHLHAAAGRALSEGKAELGLLARELLDVLPAVRSALPADLRP